MPPREIRDRFQEKTFFKDYQNFVTKIEKPKTDLHKEFKNFM